jgi:hypothetical protein
MTMKRISETVERREAYHFLKAMGVQLSPSTLSLAAHYGTGPDYEVVANRAMYSRVELTRWAVFGPRKRKKPKQVDVAPQVRPIDPAAQSLEAQA